DKLYQPRWSEDGSEIVFVDRWPGDGATVRECDIYLVENVQNIIQTKIPVSNWMNTVLISQYANPDWSPSFSMDGTAISFLSDYNFEFNNVDFWTNPDTAISLADFDAYTRDSQGINPAVAIEERNFNEGFMRWAPAGGDKFILVDRYFDTNKTYHLTSFCDSSIGGFTVRRFDPKSPIYTLFDRSKTSVTVPVSLFSKYSGDLMISVPEYIPGLQKSKFSHVGGFREFSIAGQIPKTGGEEMTVSIHYTQAEIRGVKENELIICRWNPRKGTWIKLETEVIKDGDGKPGNNDKDGGFVTVKTDELGIFGIFTDKEKIRKAVYDNLDMVRIFPNPYKAELDTLKLGILIDKLPDNIDTVNVYTISGDLVAALEDGGIEYYKQSEVPLAISTSVPVLGGVIQWKGINSSEKRIASGIYLITIKTEAGKEKILKAAVIF
ncbi:MAG: hypothetical protein PHV06_08500, partial [bacterium]|nr:hypothetical protein [bacterium]